MCQDELVRLFVSFLKLQSSHTLRSEAEEPGDLMREHACETTWHVRPVRSSCSGICGRASTAWVLTSSNVSQTGRRQLVTFAELVFSGGSQTRQQIHAIDVVWHCRNNLQVLAGSSVASDQLTQALSAFQQQADMSQSNDIIAKGAIGDSNAPPQCQPEVVKDQTEQLAVLIAVRDRALELEILLPHLRQHLDRQGKQHSIASFSHQACSQMLFLGVEKQATFASPQAGPVGITCTLHSASSSECHRHFHR